MISPWMQAICSPGCVGRHVLHQFSSCNSLQINSQRYNWMRLSLTLMYLHNQQCYTPVKPKITAVAVIMTCQGNVKIMSRQVGWGITSQCLPFFGHFSSYWPSLDLFTSPWNSCWGFQESPNFRPPMLLTTCHRVARLHSSDHSFVHVAPGSNSWTKFQIFILAS